MDGAIASGDKSLLMGKLAFAISIKDMDSDTSNKVLVVLANAGMAEAHIQLYKRYGSGDTLPNDCKKALFHLTAAAELGDSDAMAQVAAEYHQRECYMRKGPILTNIDLDEARKWYRKASESGNAWSSEMLADMLINERKARDCSRDELKEIEGLYIKAGKFFKLGNIYCTSTHTNNCSVEEMEAARKWYLRGRASKGNDAERQACTEVLRSLGEPDLHDRRPENSQTSLIEILLAPVALLIWSSIGMALLGLVLSINAITLPLIIIGAIVFGVFRAFRKNS
ncbi:tetratricopeptide repeat protein [Massilia glaciei]|uniref:Sel1 repeat family protein n=1 Tax=Massilia glaciei TaxID=1524097 RepID=A0A2U2HPF7_9BURK|nr:SEL1-like repeat protein [Massilia glaciei]PWF49400.1 hypothetical protein C7C56_006785 [Massilia glaciei]